MANLTTGSTAALAHGPQVATVLVNRIDCSVTPMAAGVHEVLNVPAGTLVTRVSVRVIKGDTGSSTRTFDVGDGTAATGFFSNIDAKTPAHVCSGLALTEGTPNTITGLSNGKFYATADTIDINADHNLTNAIIEVKALAFPM